LLRIHANHFGRQQAKIAAVAVLIIKAFADAMLRRACSDVATALTALRASAASDHEVKVGFLIDVATVISQGCSRSLNAFHSDTRASYAAEYTVKPIL
jgi:hypothetical protein